MCNFGGLLLLKTELRQYSYDDDSGDAKKWILHSRDARHKLNIEPHAVPWTSEKQLLGVRNKTGRQADLIDIAYASERTKFKRHGVAPSEVVKGLLADISQSVKRKPWSRNLPTLMQRTLVYSFDKDSVLSGSDHLRLQGSMVVVSCSTPAWSSTMRALLHWQLTN